MKEVMAIVRQNMMNRTKEALSEAGFPAFTATKVVGRGQGVVDWRVLTGAEAGAEEAIAQLGDGPRLVPKRLVTVVVPDGAVGTVIETIIATNKTGKPGDGKIFVLPVAEAVRIRTGETDEAAVDEHVN
jgi:nitrogen regulatory protein PII 2